MIEFDLQGREEMRPVTTKTWGTRQQRPRKLGGRKHPRKREQRPEKMRLQIHNISLRQPYSGRPQVAQLRLFHLLDDAITTIIVLLEGPIGNCWLVDVSFKVIWPSYHRHTLEITEVLLPDFVGSNISAEYLALWGWPRWVSCRE